MSTRGYELGLGLTEDHQALAESVRRFTEREITPHELRAAMDAPAAQLPPYWHGLAEQGVLGLHIPEEHGGQGGGLLELAVALEALGRAAHPGPVLPTVLASALLLAGDAKTGLLAGFADGSCVAGVGLAEPLTGTPGGDGLVVHGSTSGVLGGTQAIDLLLPVRIDGDIRWVVVAAERVRVTARDGLDLLRGAAEVSADELTVPEEHVLRGLPEPRVRAIAGVLFGAEAVGVASWCVSTAAEYARTRVQFGRPIGQFQGVKHKCAQLGIALEQARAVVWDVAGALDAQDDTAEHAAAVASAVAPDAAVRCAQDCIQILGGVGFTWEHDAHLYYRRALTLRGMLGPREQRVGRVARDALDGVTRSVTLELPAEAGSLRERIRGELAEIAALDDEQRLVRLGDGGWVQPHLPRPWGKGAGPLEQIVIQQELRAAGITLPELAMGGWAVQAIVAHGTEEQKRTHVGPTLRGEVIWCQLFSEPEAGSDLASLRTRAERVDGGWRITGQKIWTSLAQFAGWAILIARTDPDVPKHDGITYFLLDMSTPGVTVRPLREITGSAMFNEVFLDEVFIPDGNVVGEVNDGWHVARTTLAGERVALSQGLALYASIKDLLAFARDRELSEPAVQRVGELVCEAQAMELIGTRVVLGQLTGTDVSTTSSVGKLLNMRIGQWIAEFCLDQLGTAGVMQVPGQPSDKWMDQILAGRATTIYGGTTEVQLNVIAERMLGLPRDT